VANTKLMLSGGLQEPRDLIALAVLALGGHPDQLEEVRADRRLIKAAVEETLRWAGPVGTSTRQTTRATELGGVGLEEGALIGAVLSSANRDPRRYADADRFDIHRKEGAHLAFAVGNHFCLGAWFGRHLARVSLEILLDRLPNLRLEPERPATLSGWEFRAPTRPGSAGTEPRALRRRLQAGRPYGPPGQGKTCASRRSRSPGE
jgi:cytochrome P450